MVFRSDASEGDASTRHDQLDSGQGLFQILGKEKGHRLPKTEHDSLLLVLLHCWTRLLDSCHRIDRSQESNTYSNPKATTNSKQEQQEQQEPQNKEK